MRLQFLLALGVVCLLVAADKKDEIKTDTNQDAIKQEKDRLKGSWQAISVIEPEGKERPKDEARMLSLVFTEEKAIIKFGDEKKELTWKLDPAKKPPTIDLIGIEGDDKGKIALGIYELNGDSFKLCIGEPGNDRPTELKADKNTKAGIITFKRDKK